MAGFSRGHSRNRDTVKSRQRSISAQPIREKVRSLKDMNYVSTRKQQNILQLTTIMKVAVPSGHLPKQVLFEEFQREINEM